MAEVVKATTGVSTAMGAEEKAALEEAEAAAAAAAVAAEAKASAVLPRSRYEHQLTWACRTLWWRTRKTSLGLRNWPR